MSELRILVSKKEIEGVPSDIYKIIIQDDEEIVINPKERKYFVGKPFNLSLEGKLLQIDLDTIKVNNKLHKLDGGVLYILFYNKSICIEHYSSLEVFKMKYGFSGNT